MRRNRIIYYLLCAAALAFASFYGGPVSYTILFGLVLVAPLSYAYLYVVYSFFRIYQSASGKHIVAYEPVPYYFILQNEYLLNFCHIRRSWHCIILLSLCISMNLRDNSRSCEEK